MTEQEALVEISKIALDKKLGPSAAVLRIIAVLAEVGYIKRKAGR